MARLPNGCIRMLCALLQFGSLVSAVNKPSPPTARTRRSEPRTALSKRFSSLSSSTRSWPETMTIGAPIMSSQKIGPSSLVSRTRCCTGALASSDSMLPTTGFFGGCGIGLSLLVGAIARVSPAAFSNEIRHSGDGPKKETSDVQSHIVARSFASPRNDSYGSFAPRNDDDPAPLAEALSTPFDQLGADLVRLFLLRPVAATANQVFLQIGDQLLHAVRSRWRQYRVVLGHDHQRRYAHSVVDTFRALPVARHVAVPVDATGEAGPGEGVDEHLLLLGGQDWRARIMLGVVAGNHLRKRQIKSRGSADTGHDRFAGCGVRARHRLAHEGIKSLLDAAAEYSIGLAFRVLELDDIHLLAEAGTQQCDRIGQGPVG